MTVEVKNFFSWDDTGTDPDQEDFEHLVQRQGFRLERIISRGNVSAPDQWYDQETDEWVVLLKGRASLEFEGGITFHLTSGDYILIPARLKHRVSYTSKTPPCIWLALHMNPDDCF